MLLSLTWPDFKTQLGSIPFKYISVSGVYYVAAGNDLFELNCAIVQDGGPNQVDFETNYQSLAVNYNISPLSPGSYSNVTGNTTATIKSSPGVLMGVMINNNGTDGVLTIYDNTAASGTKIGTLQLGTPSGGLLSSSGIQGPAGFIAMNVRFTTGLTVVTTGSSSNNVTLIYR